MYNSFSFKLILKDDKFMWNSFKLCDQLFICISLILQNRSAVGYVVQWKKRKASDGGIWYCSPVQHMLTRVHYNMVTFPIAS